jgi:plasmid stability protein
MSNLTIAVDDELIKLARIRAIQQGTSLSAKVREFLQAYVNESDALVQRQRADAAAQLLAAIESATSQTQATAEVTEPGTAPRRSLRDELYDGEFRARDRQAESEGGADAGP